MDPFELLKADHKKVAELFDRLESGTGKAKLATFKQIKKELEVHTHIEEKIFYPALESPKETHDLTLEAYEEHNVVKSLLSQLAKGRKADDEWQAKAKVLRENVEHHVKEEENELFDKASDALESDRLEALGDEMAAEKARKEGKPGPRQEPKASKSKKVGLISRLASLVGLGGASKAVKKPAKKAAKKSGSKSTKKATKTSAKKTSTKSTAKAATKSSQTTKSQKQSKTSQGTKASKARASKAKKTSR